MKDSIKMETPTIEAESLTPIPRKQGESITMSFPDAMREVIKGSKVTRIEWANKDYGFLKDEWLSISKDDKFHTWLVSSADMEAQDWIVVIDATKN